MNFQEFKEQKKKDLLKATETKDKKDLLDKIDTISKKDYSDKLSEIIKILEKDDLLKELSQDQVDAINKIEIPKTDTSKIENLLKGIKFPEQKIDTQVHKLLEVINKSVSGIEIDIPKTILQDSKQHIQLVKLLDSIKKEIINSSKETSTIISRSGSGTDNSLLEKIASNTASSETVYATNEIYENGTDTYFCKESKDGEWYIMKIDTNSVFSHSTIINNPTITTYAGARTNVLTLTYGNYNQAF